MGLRIRFNNVEYIAKYNEQTNYYEIELQAPDIGGIYQADITYIDILGNRIDEKQTVQVLAKEKVKIQMNKVFIYIFDSYDFKMKDVVEISNYDINIDQETNANTIINILKNTTATSKDIVAIKKNNKIVYWGIIDNIQNEDGKNLYEFNMKYITNMFNQTIELQNENIIKTKGIEDFIEKAITDNFIKNEDEFINKKYLEVISNTHTKLEKTVDNVENGIYYLNTFMTNCTKNYNIIYRISVVNKKLRITIEKEEKSKQLINTKAQNISNYTEVFETSIVSKVKVLTAEEGTYTLYLLNDRTTTENKLDINRAIGETKIIYTEKMENAKQEALDIIKQNSYKHMISFNMLNEYIQVGTPIAIKTKNSIILDTYISAVRITQNNFYEYICGNMRVKFIDKILKERNN